MININNNSRSEANLRRFGNYDWTQTKWVVARYVALRDPDSYPGEPFLLLFFFNYFILI